MQKHRLLSKRFRGFITQASKDRVCCVAGGIVRATANFEAAEPGENKVEGNGEKASCISRFTRLLRQENPFTGIIITPTLFILKCLVSRPDQSMKPITDDK